MKSQKEEEKEEEVKNDNEEDLMGQLNQILDAEDLGLVLSKKESEEQIT